MSVVKFQPPSAPSRAGHRRMLGILVLVCLVGACKKEAAVDPAATAPGAATQAAAPPPPAVSAAVAAMTADQLREAASAALREQRLYAPAGSNAMEYYLALRDKQPNDPAVASALTDLMPYALIATEQAIGREDFTESQRLYALMEKTDAQAPALPRLKQTIAAQQQAVAARAEQETTETAAEEAKRVADQEKKRLEDQQRTQQQAAQQLAQQQAAQREADQRAAAEREAAQRAAAQPAAPAQPTAPAPSQAAPSTAAASGELRQISQASPRYPPEAARRQQSGEVQIEFTVGTDGAVTSARVVGANPPRVFDREALAAVKKWRFQPVNAPVTTRRTISFNPGG
jgi:periplasmic protein TonB